MTSSPSPTCSVCRFALLAQPGVYFCRRFPPVPVSTPRGPVVLFPTMDSKGWCGEYATKVVLQ